MELTGKIAEDLGWIMDFAEMDAVVGPIVKSLDHKTLNDVPGLENPTSEVLAAWLFERLRPDLPGLSEIEVCETERSGCRYRG